MSTHVSNLAGHDVKS